MEYKTKSAIIGRKKNFLKLGKLTPFIELCDVNDPHKSPDCPKKILEFPKCKEVKIFNGNVKYMVAGNDLIINDLEKVTIEEHNSDLIVKCVHKN
ncbi:MAG: hypothetical protein WC413_00460 [Candidatus Nanoarchaeia archaeon]